MSAVPQPRPSPMVERFLATLHARGINGHCPFCQKNSWIILENPASIPVYESTMQLRMPGTNMPMATMICNNCGWSGFFSLGALGLLRPQNAAPGAATMANSGAPVGGDPAPPTAHSRRIICRRRKPRDQHGPRPRARRGVTGIAPAPDLRCQCDSVERPSTGR